MLVSWSSKEFRFGRTVDVPTWVCESLDASLGVKEMGDASISFSMLARARRMHIGAHHCSYRFSLLACSTATSLAVKRRLDPWCFVYQSCCTFIIQARQSSASLRSLSTCTLRRTRIGPSDSQFQSIATLTVSAILEPEAAKDRPSWAAAAVLYTFPSLSRPVYLVSDS